MALLFVPLRAGRREYPLPNMRRVVQIELDVSLIKSVVLVQPQTPFAIVPEPVNPGDPRPPTDAEGWPLWMPHERGIRLSRDPRLDAGEVALRITYEAL